MVSRAIIHAGIFVLAGGSVAFGQSQDFYHGKQVSLMVNYTAGGPTDTEARILARYLTKHIPGNPVVVIRNMGGAGGMVGANWLSAVAPGDGLNIGYLTSLVVAAASGSSSLKSDPVKLRHIASVQGSSVTYARSDIGGGIKSPEDILTKSGFWVGGLSPDTQRDLLLRAQFDLLGLTYKYVSGYTGASETRLAIERNEIQVSGESMPTYRTAIEPALVKAGKVIPLWYNTSARFVESGDPDAAGLNSLPFEAFYHQRKGPSPDSALWKMNSLISEIASSFIRTIHVPPGTPEASVSIFRKAVSVTASDPEFQSETTARLGYVPKFDVGERAEKLFQDTVSIDPSMKQFIQDYVAAGVAAVGK